MRRRVQDDLNQLFAGFRIATAGLLVTTPFLLFAASTIDTGRALGALASVGVKDFGVLSQAAAAFTNEWAGVRKVEFLEAAFDMKSALSDLSDSGVADMTRMAALTGKATRATTQEMVTLFTTASEVFGQFRREVGTFTFAERLSASVAATAANFRTTGSKLSQGLSSLGAIGSQRGFNLQEQLSTLGLLQGSFKAEVAGTGFRSFIAQLPKAAEKLKVGFQDANSNALTLLGTLRVLQQRTEGLTGAQTQELLTEAFGLEAGPTVAALLGNFDRLRDAIRNTGREMDQGALITRRMADTMNRDLGARLDLLRQRFRNLSETIGETLLPVLRPVVDGISAAVASMNNLLARFPALATGFTTVSLGAGIATSALGGLIAGGATLRLAGPALSTALTSIGFKMRSGLGPARSLGLAFRQLAGRGRLLGLIFTGSLAVVFFKIVAVIAVVIAAFAGLRKAWDNDVLGLRTGVLAVVDTLQLFHDGVVGVFRTLQGNVGQLSGDLKDRLEEKGLLGTFIKLTQALFRVRQFFVGVFEGISESVKANGSLEALGVSLGRLGSAVSQLFRAFVSLGDAIFGTFGLTTAGVFQNFGKVVGSVIGFVVNVALTLIGILADLAFVALKVETFVVRALTNILKVLRPVFSGVASLFKFFLGGEKGASQTALPFGGTGVSDAPNLRAVQTQADTGVLVERERIRTERLVTAAQSSSQSLGASREPTTLRNETVIQLDGREIARSVEERQVQNATRGFN